MTIKSSGTISALDISTELGSYTPVVLDSIRTRGVLLRQQAVGGSSVSLSEFYSKDWNYNEPIYRTNSAPGGTVPGPVNNYYRRELIKVWYLTGEFSNVGWGGGSDGDRIYELTFNLTSVPTYSPYPNYRIYMQNVTTDGTTDLTSGWTLVYTRASQSFALGENSYILDTSFVRSPGYNLAVCWAWDQCPTNWSSTGVVTVDSTTGYTWRYSLTDSAGSYQPTEATNATTTNRPSPRFRRVPYIYRPAVTNNSSAVVNTVGTTTAGPVNNYFRRQVFKSTFTAAEIKTAIGWPSYASSNSTIFIPRVSWYVAGVPTYQPYPNYKFYMQNTTTAPGTDITTGWTTVYTNSSQSFSVGDFVIGCNWTWTTANNIAFCWAWAQCPTTWSTTGQVSGVFNSGNSNYNWTDSAGEWAATDSAPNTTNYRPVMTFYSNSKIICTKLNQLGLLPDEIFNVDQEFGIMLQKNDPDAHAGYLAWAVIVVDWMEGLGIKMMPWMSDQEFSKAISKWAIKWAYDLASPWALEMARQQGIRETSPWAGKIMMSLGIPLSRVIGRWKARHPRKTDPGFGTGLAMIGVFSLLKVLVGSANIAESLFNRIRSRKSS